MVVVVGVVVVVVVVQHQRTAHLAGLVNWGAKPTFIL
jgi:hypothetical protein